MDTRPSGWTPVLAGSNEARVVIWWLPLGTSNTVPTPLAPPFWVVPKRFPAASMTNPLCGLAPSDGPSGRSLST